MAIRRYSVLENIGIPREIILLKGFPCKWGICSFCDYIHDNSEDEKELNDINFKILKKVTGKYGALEVINSGSCLELPQLTLNRLKEIVIDKNINHLFFEAHWSYRERLKEIKDLFGVKITFITGIETFDENFRNKILKKGIHFESIEEIKKYFQSICLMVGVKGQTKEMISKDIEILLKNFPHGTINLYQDNSTDIVADEELKAWFKSEYKYLEDNPNIDILWNITDFGVGEEI